SLIPRPPRPTLFPYTTLFRSLPDVAALSERAVRERPDLAGSRAAIEGAHAQERLARANRIPDLGLFVAEMHTFRNPMGVSDFLRSEEHTSELQSLAYLVCRLL